MAEASTDPADAGFKRAVADGDLARSFRTWAHTFVTKALALASGLLAAANETDADWVKPAARFANFQATSAAAGAKRVEESKGDESKFDQLLAAMAKQTAQTDAGLTQMREAQAQAQQAQTQMMQMMGAIFANQEQQRLTNAWVTSSITNISASSGCATEAAPTPQPIITLPPALVRLGGGAANPGVTVTPVQPNAAAATEAPALAVRAGGEGAANAPSDARKRSPKAHPPAGGGAASSTAAAIMSAGGSPPRKKSLPPGNGAPPLPEDAGRTQ